MIDFCVSDDIFQELPELKIGMVTTQGLDQKQLTGSTLFQIHKLQKVLRTKLTKYPTYKDLPVVKAWHQAFKKLSINPKKYPPAIENLIRITAKEIDLSPINPLVDLENYISLKYSLPVGGQDLAKVKGGIRLEILSTSLPFRALGRQEPKTIRARLPVYRDQDKILCIALNSKDCGEASFRETSTDIVIFVETLGNGDKLSRALSELGTYLKPVSQQLATKIFKAPF